MIHPTDPYIKTVLTTTTARAGQRVEVYSHPGAGPVAHQGATGQIIRVADPIGMGVMALVAIDQYSGSPTWIPLYHLHPLD